jgi:hypothetical protein
MYLVLGAKDGFMAKYVCSGAKLKCSMGSRESALGVMPVRRSLVRIKGNLMGTIMDNKPFLNIKPFGQCQSLANPTVAAATAASNGKLQKMPCVPNTATPWIGGKMRVCICGEPTLLDNSKLMCLWAGFIEITDPGQDFVQEGFASSLDSQDDAVASEEKVKEIDVVAGETVEHEEVKKITVKDVVEILEKIEAKQGYEAARYYATNCVDYWGLNNLAKRYVAETDKEKNEAEQDNDPNLMPSRFMLLYGADDEGLRGQGNINDHPDRFEGEEHEISVANLRKGLKLLGYNIEENSRFDDALYHAFLQYHWQHGRVRLGGVYEEDDDFEKPLDDIADKYGMFTWKIFQDKYNGKVDHDNIQKELNTEYGDELLTEKGADPQTYRPGVAYHYVWVPFRLTINRNEEESKARGDEKESKYEILDGKNYTRVAEGAVVDNKIEGLFPNADNPLIFVDGAQIFFNPEEPEVTYEPQIVKTYWSYGEDQQRLRKEVSRHYADLNLHVKTRHYNDGDIVSFTVKREGSDEVIELCDAVYDNEVVFKNVFKDYTAF